MTKSYHPSQKKPYLRLTWLLDAKQVITDIARKEADLDTLKAGASLIPAKVPKVVKAIGNVGKTGFKKGKEGEKTVWKRFIQKDQPEPNKNKGNQSKTGSKSGTTTSKPNQEEASKSSQAKQTKAKNKGGSGNKVETVSESGKYSITVSQDRLQHSVLGQFNSNGRLINGEHGQANIDYLDKNNIEYNIVKVYDNGVRVGNISSHKNKFKRTGTVQA